MTAKNANEGAMRAATAAAVVGFSLLAAPTSPRAEGPLEQLRGLAALDAPAGASPSPTAVPAEPAPSVRGADDGWRRCSDRPEEAEIARRLGLGRSCMVRKRHLGNFLINPTEKLTFRDGASEVSVVRKAYGLNLGSLKWRFSAGRYPFRRVQYDPRRMYANQLEMNAAFREAGLKTADIVAAFPDRRVVVTRFLEAEGLDRAVARALSGDPASLALVGRMGAELAKAHRAGLTVGDMGPQNALVQDGGIYFFDLDQGARGGPYGWDVAKFLFDMPKSLQDADAENPSPAGPDWRSATRAFLSGYLRAGGDPANVGDALNPQYTATYGSNYDRRALDAIRSEIEAAGRVPEKGRTHAP